MPRALVVLGIALAVATGSSMIVVGALTGFTTERTIPAPLVIPTWHPIAVPSSVPQPAVPENKVIPASAPVRLEIPNISFDSSMLGGRTSNSIQQWTKAMNDAAHGVVTPPGAYNTSIVWDSTVAGGGLFGTDVQSNGRILAHTSPYDRALVDQGVFNPLDKVRDGNPVAITTANGGKLCYNVLKVDKLTPKDQLNVVYNKETVIPGLVYLITCSRPEGQVNGATKNNLVVTLQLNQQQTNTGSCW